MRQFIAETELDADGCLLVDKNKFHYLRNVLRIVEGDMISVRLTNGTLQQMTIASVDEKKKCIIMQIAGERAGQNKTDDLLSNKHVPELWLFQFIAKPVKMELIVRQAVECGVSVIVPVKGKFCQSGAIKSAEEAANNFSKGGRWDRIILEAREQSGSPIKTRVTKCVTVNEAISLKKEQVLREQSGSIAVVLYEQTLGTVSMKMALKNCRATNYASIVVGAEGGISPEELDELKNGGFVPVHFTTNILRCETAALYGMASLQTLLEKE